MFKRFTGVMCGVAMCFTASAWGQDPAAPEPIGVTNEMPGLIPMEAPTSEAPAVEMLFKRVESIDWNETTFEEVLTWVREQGEGRVNVVPRFNQLGIEGVGLDTLVTLQLNNTTVADVLNEALGYISETGAVRFRASGNKLTISTQADFERKMYTRVYDVTDIMFRVNNFGQSAPQIDLQQAGQQGGGGGGGGGGQSVFQGSSAGGEEDEGGRQAEQEMEERLEKLRQLIEQSIEPQSWDLTGSESQNQVGTGAGGGRGRIRVFNRSLVITNTIEVHEQIAGLFAFGS